MSVAIVFVGTVVVVFLIAFALIGLAFAIDQRLTRHHRTRR